MNNYICPVLFRLTDLAPALLSNGSHVADIQIQTLWGGLYAFKLEQYVSQWCLYSIIITKSTPRCRTLQRKRVRNKATLRKSTNHHRRYWYVITWRISTLNTFQEKKLIPCVIFQMQLLWSPMELTDSRLLSCHTALQTPLTFSTLPAHVMLLCISYTNSILYQPSEYTLNSLITLNNETKDPSVLENVHKPSWVFQKAKVCKKVFITQM